MSPIKTAMLATCALALTGAATESPSQSPAITVQATDYLQASEGVRKDKEDRTVTLAPGENWFNFDVTIPVAGRYRVGITARGDTELNLEDYIHNTDGRNYDITAPMPVHTADDFVLVSKDGSPLNRGMHSMRLHAKGGAAAIQSITFQLIKPHELTPYTLRQNLEGEQWVLVWADEFEEAGQPDPKVWAHDIGNWGWGNREPQYYTERRLENSPSG